MLSRRVKIFACIALILSCFCPGACYAAGFNGNWRVTFDCPKEDDRCANGVADSFILYSVTQNDGHICATHSITWLLTNRVDEGYVICGELVTLYGTVRKNTAVVYFGSSWTKTIGKARLTYNPHDDTLTWTLIAAPGKGADGCPECSNGAWWYPNKVVLKRDHRYQYKAFNCRNCTVR